MMYPTVLIGYVKGRFVEKEMLQYREDYGGQVPDCEPIVKGDRSERTSIAVDVTAVEYKGKEISDRKNPHTVGPPLGR
ncbi:hypothetical protein HZH66_002123 [Vespula vulgaris]|uniref:Uncharacterized protein n=1 Tax=Vespula vulgaris TaxID=7454 RepID=A0A834KIU3_VESVU|nr:hypothetical protein HZH66_002123 [Vespula vulgaris]